MPLPPPEQVADALAAGYGRLTAVVTDLDDDTLHLPTRCRGWLVADLLLHLLGDAQRALVALATPAAPPADVDHVTYWAAFPPSADRRGPAQHARWVRRSAAAFDRPTAIVGLWRETAAAAVHAARAADPAGHLRTQGRVLAVPEFLATLVTEAVVHHLDLTVDLPAAAAPDDAAVGIARATVAGLAPGLPEWTATEHLLKATGRIGLDDDDRRRLGAAAGRYPVLG